MNDDIEVSVIVPAYNAAATIGVQLDALSKQIWSGRWEVIIADNGSTDDTVAVAQKWQNRLPHLRIIDASAARGPSHARNVGVSVASSNYFLFIDADDAVQEGWLAGMAESARLHKLIAGSAHPVSDASLDPAAGLGRTTRWSVVLPSRGFLDAAASNNLGVSREVWEEVGGFREAMRSSHDTAFCWDAQLHGYSIHRVATAKVNYIMRSNARQLWKQQYRWGVAAAQLYSIYRVHGAPRPSVSGAIVRWGGLIVMAPATPFSRAFRRDWVGRAARRCGRVVGSVRFHVLAL